MSKVEQLLDEYGESHKNATNKAIHWICIPIIMFSLVGVLWIIPFPSIFEEGSFLDSIANWGTLLLIFALFYYLRLSFTLFLGFVVISAALVLGNRAIYEALGHNNLYQFLVSLAIFVGAWVGQFIGHNIEGKKPSFMKDLQFLLIGPAWLLAFIYRSVGIPYK